MKLLQRGLSAIFCLSVCSLCAAVTPRHVVKGEYSLDIGPVPAWVQASPEPGAPAENDAPVSVIKVDRQADRRADQPARYEYFFGLSMRANNAQALGELANFKAEFNPSFQRLVLHDVSIMRDGKRIERLNADEITMARREQGLEASVLNGEVTALLVLNDMRVGDILHYSYTLIGENPVLNGLTAEVFSLGLSSAAAELKIRVLFPADTQPLFAFGAKGEAIGTHSIKAFPAKAGIGAVAHAAYQAFEFSATSVPAYEFEDMVPRWYAQAPYLSVSKPITWANVADWGVQLFQTDNDVKALAPVLAEIRTGSHTGDGELSDTEKVLRSLSYVQNKIRYFGIFLGDSSHRPNPPSLVLERRYGDCKDKSNLLVKLLQAQGLTAWPVLVNTDKWRAVASYTPNMYAFNHVITAVEVAGQRYFIDPTASQELGSLAQLSQQPYGFGLSLRTGETELTAVTQAPLSFEDSGVDTKLVLTPAASGKAMTLALQRRYRGPLANVIRVQRAQVSEAARNKATLGMVSALFGEAQLVGKTVVKEHRAHFELEIKEQFLLKNPWTVLEGGQLALNAEATGLSSYIEYPRKLPRIAPLDQVWPGRFEHEIVLTLPQNQQYSGGPSSVSLKNPGFTYTLSQSAQGSVVRLNHRFEVLKRELSGEDLRKTLADSRALQEHFSRRILVRQTDHVDDRARRLKAIMEGN
jgi:hypothetical protein